MSTVEVIDDGELVRSNGKEADDNKYTSQPTAELAAQGNISKGMEGQLNVLRLLRRRVLRLVAAGTRWKKARCKWRSCLLSRCVIAYLHTRCACIIVHTLSYLGFELNRSNWHDGRSTSFASNQIRHRMQWEGRLWR